MRKTHIPHEHRRLYEALGYRMERGMSRQQMRLLLRLFVKRGLPLPVDFQAVLVEAGMLPVSSY